MEHRELALRLLRMLYQKLHDRILSSLKTTQVLVSLSVLVERGDSTFEPLHVRLHIVFNPEQKGFTFSCSCLCSLQL